MRVGLKKDGIEILRACRASAERPLGLCHRAAAGSTLAGKLFLSAPGGEGR